MHIRVLYTAQLKTALGRSEEPFELDEECSLAELLVRLASEWRPESAPFLLGAQGALQPTLLVAVNHEAVAAREAGAVRIRGGDVVTLLPPIAGG